MTGPAARIRSVILDPLLAVDLLDVSPYGTAMCQTAAAKGATEEEFGVEVDLALRYLEVPLLSQVQSFRRGHHIAARLYRACDRLSHRLQRGGISGGRGDLRRLR